MTPECKRCRPLLSAILDGEVAPEEEAYVQQHLSSCGDCRDVLASYRLMSQRIGTLSHPVPPSQLRTAVMARVRGDRVVVLGRKPVPGLNPFLTFGQKLAIGLTALVVFLLAGLLIFGILRTEPFELEGQPVAVAGQGEPKVVVAFTRPVDKAYIISHASELFVIKDENGNPLEIDLSRITVDGSKVELPLKRESSNPIEPSDSLRIEVNPDLKDQSGAKIANPGLKVARVVTPTQAPGTATPRQTSIATALPPTATGAPVVITATATSAPIPTVTPVSPSPTAVITPTATTLPSPSPTTVITATATVTSTVSTPGGTLTPGVTVTPAATPTFAPTPVGSVVSTITTTVTATATVTLTPSSSVTPAISPAGSVTPSGSGCQISPRNSFGRIYNSRPEVAGLLGCPLQAEAPASLTYQPFQGGALLYHSATGWIYVLHDNGTWVRFRDPGPVKPPAPTASPSAQTPGITSLPPSPSPPACAIAARGGFANLLNSNAGVRTALGCPLAAERSGSGGLYQPYDQGLMFANPLAQEGRRIYVLYQDGTYLNLAA